MDQRISEMALEAHTMQLKWLKEGPAHRIAKSVNDFNLKEVSPGERALLFCRYNNKDLLMLMVFPIDSELLMFMGVVKGTNQGVMCVIAAHAFAAEVVLVSSKSEEAKNAQQQVAQAKQKSPIGFQSSQTP